MSTAANQATLANWMRVQISVRNGKDASAAARAAARLTPWHDIHPAYACDVLHVYAVDFIPEGWVFVDPAKDRIAFSRDSYFTLAHDQQHLQKTIAEFAARESSGLFRVPLTPGMAKASAVADAAPADRLQQLDEDYRALMSRLRVARQDGDSRALGEGLSQVRALRERHVALCEEIERLGVYDQTVKSMVRELA